MRSRHLIAPLICTLTLTFACQSDSDQDDPPGTPQEDMSSSTEEDMASPGEDMSSMEDMGAEVVEPPAGATTYHGEVRAILEEHCVECHTAGQIGPFELEYDPEDWAQGPPWWAQAVMASVEAGTMPPWMPDDDCRPLQGRRGLSDQERAALEAWARDGFWQGDPADYSPPAIEDAQRLDWGEPDLSLSLPVAYEPSTEFLDDYRCFILDHDFEEETYITGVQVHPDAEELVHHVILYVIPPSDVPGVEGKDADDEGPGYECFGDPGSSSSKNIAGWVPGAVPSKLDDGAAFVIPAGSRLVAQMHYNTINVPAGEDPEGDQTSADIWLMPEGEVPEQEIRVIPFANLQLEVPPGEANSVQQRTYAFPHDATLVGMTPHMHTLGTSHRLELLDEAGEATCLIDIPRWDFNWQQSYRLEPEAAVALERGARLRQTCTYDNTPSNQQVVEGEQITPQMVRWGDGTLDEMCLTYAVVAIPFSAQRGVECSLVDDCLQGCAADDSGCFLDCALKTSGECSACAFDVMFDCPTDDCLEPVLELAACNRRCNDEAGQGLGCLERDCAAEWSAYYECAIHAFQDGSCQVGVCE